jgi:polysaccharide export outer membrane protein
MIFPGETLFERLASLLLGLAALSVLAGCQSASSKTTRFDGGQPFVTESLALSPGDEVDVRFYYTPELNVTQTVRPDGKIMLQLIGEVEARGKSPDKLRGELLQRYGPQLKDPDITVLTRSLYTRRVYVGGQVISPGVVNMPSQMTVLEAIMQSGGFRLPDA